MWLPRHSTVRSGLRRPVGQPEAQRHYQQCLLHVRQILLDKGLLSGCVTALLQWQEFGMKLQVDERKDDALGTLHQEGAGNLRPWIEV